MKKRASDDNNAVSDREIKQQRASAFQWATLFLSNLPMIVKVIGLLAVGAGTAVTAPHVKDTLFASESTLPTAAGTTTAPNQSASQDAWRAQATQSMQSFKEAIDNNTAAVLALQAELRAVEERRAADSNRQDAALRADVEMLKSKVQ